ncbi:ComEA family DNA-binding protein [Nocardioides sp. AE5]|uniref:ComEA family DNA-binding protein n=1 Tax=Nocardioides sp. AE5 TaxID=2962573 RepID=UPI002881DE00|nr:ComEA family DNA-binding protein [Nocardioides sp. AE5]MDT0201064.1 ComEA family DNA-binding protein [Nocardioides sp. AE5]
MLSRGRSPERNEAVARRLALLSAELGVPDPGEEHTRVRQVHAVEWTGDEGEMALADDGGRGADDLVEPGEPAEPPQIRAPGRHAAPRRSRWVDASFLRGRVALTAAHVAVLAVVAALALAITTWWVLRDGPGTPLVASSSSASPLASGMPSGAVAPDGTISGAAPEADPAADLVVDVAGKVRRPGIVVLPPGSRVVDAIEAAGGPAKGADLTGLNQARLLVDGEQILVGVPPPPGVAPSAAAAPGGGPGAEGLVNINTAAAAQLEALPGVGPVTAQAIVSWREANGGFRSVDQLLEVDGIGEKTLARMAPMVTL